jgi:hypothetical protein
MRYSIWNSVRSARTELKFALPQRRLAAAEMTAEKCDDFLDQEFHGVFDFVERKEEPAPASRVSPERRTEGRSRLPLRA